MDFGLNIRQVRKQRGLTQVALGELAGLSQSYISMLEGNQRPNVSAINLKRIADALGITVDELLKEDREKREVIEEAGKRYNPEDFTIWPPAPPPPPPPLRATL